MPISNNTSQASSAPAKNGLRKRLSAEQMKMTCTELMDHLVCSKATAWRALRNGFYCPGYNGTIKQRALQRDAKSKLKPLKARPPAGKTVKLSKVEQQLSRNELARRYNIGHQLATQALKARKFVMPTAQRPTV